MPRRGTWARAGRRRRSTAPAPCSQRRRRCATSFSMPRRSASRPLAATWSSSTGTIRVKGSPEKQVTIAALASDGTFHGKGAGELPTAPEAPAEGCVGRLGNESFHAPQLIAHAAHVKVDRETGVVRVLRVAAAHDCGRILNRPGADGQVYGGVVMGIGQALSEGTQLDERRAAAQPAPPRLQAGHGRRRTGDPRSPGSRPTPRTPARRARRASASRRACPTAGAIANAVAKVIGARVRQLPMTPERVWDGTGERCPTEAAPVAFATASSLDDALAALAAGARPVAGGTDLVVGARQGKAPLPERLVAIHRLEELRGIEETATGLRLGALVDARRARGAPGGAGAVHRHRRRRGDRRLARDPGARDARRQPR